MPLLLGANHTPAPPAIKPLTARASLHLMSVPNTVNWFAACPADGDSLGNDQVGDCDPVAKLRTMQVRRANAWGDTWKPTQADAFALYTLFTGFNPITLKPDDGTDTAKAMAIWATQGIRLDSQNLDVVHWATVDPTDDRTISLAIAATGPVQVTLALPAAMEDLSTWSQPPGSGAGWEPGSWGTHRVAAGAFDGLVRVCRTWGIDLPMHPDIWAAYAIAVDASLSREWLTTTGLSPAGLDWNSLEADMAQLG